MTTLKIALAQSPIRSASAQTPHGEIEVRALMVDRADGQRTWTRAWRYEVLTSGRPQWTGSYSEIVEITGHLRAEGRELDWQPLYERASHHPPMTGNDHTARHAPGVH